MPILLQLRAAHKTLGDRVLLDDARAVVGDSHNVGLVGRNGAGKTTLCRILLGEEELDAGEVERRPGLRVAALPQHDPFLPGETVTGYLRRESGRPEWRCGETAARFELKGALLDRPVAELSGGRQTRVKLAAMLLHEPDLLILDEPTNFLDLRTQLLLERFLRDFRGACLVVSHDRTFLKTVCDRTLELSRGKLTAFPGDIEAYLEHRRVRREHALHVNAATATKRRRLETFIAKNRAGANTASQARSKAKQLEQLRFEEVETEEAAVRIYVPETGFRPGTVLHCNDLKIGYPEHVVATDVNLEVEAGSRVAVVGDNGEGKTTFLRTIAGSLSLLGGEIRWGRGRRVGFFAQHVYASLPETETVVEYLVARAAPGTDMQTILNTAGSFLFGGRDAEKPIRVLSGGERARLCLAGLLLGRHDVLVLDEPVNHLDVETVEALAGALTAYQGTVLFSSHDRSFTARTATHVVEVRDGRVKSYPGDYETYLYRVRRKSEEEAELSAAGGKRKRKNAGRRRNSGNGQTAGRRKSVPNKERQGAASKEEAERTARKAAARRRYEIKKEAESLERRVTRLDEEKRRLERKQLELLEPEEARALQEQLDAVVKKLAEVEARWFALLEEVEA